MYAVRNASIDSSTPPLHFHCSIIHYVYVIMAPKRTVISDKLIRVTSPNRIFIMSMVVYDGGKGNIIILNIIIIVGHEKTTNTNFCELSIDFVQVFLLSVSILVYGIWMTSVVQPTLNIVLSTIFLN